MLKSSERFLRTCQNREVDYPPVWIMRQAGRALPEYRAMREKYSFWQLIKTPELAAKVSLQPVERFKMDACVIFSDILVVPAAMGVKVDFDSGVSLSPVIRKKGDVEKLKRPEVEKSLGYVAQTIKNIKAEVGDESAILGFSGAPFILAAYMIEGENSRLFTRTKTMMLREPVLFRKLIGRISDLVSDYLEMQIEAGADAVQIFDTWAGELAPIDYEHFLLPALQKIIRRAKAKGAPVIYYVNGIGNLLELAANSGADVLGVDWRIRLSEVRKRLGINQVLQGNLDPLILMGTEKLIRERVFAMLDETRGRGHIANLGHGLLPDTPLKSIATFVKSVKEWAHTKK
jgi:uroporphyrinogen decarboxylase